MKVALVHDWLDGYRGGERVLKAIAEIFPDAPIYTLFFDSKKLPVFFKSRKIFYPSILNHMRYFRRHLLPFLPAAIESLDLQDFDLIISSSSCVAKGVVPNPYAKHICYIHTPMRYIWDQSSNYDFRSSSIPGLKFLFSMLSNKLRIWDSSTTHRVDTFVSNSQFISKRVKRYYGRDSLVLPPPVDVNRVATFISSKKLNERKDDYYVTGGAFVPYKRFDLVLSAFKKTKRKLIVAGSGPLLSSLSKNLPDNIKFVVSPSDEKLFSLIHKARAFIMPGVEDFGILPIEVMACGTPVLAYKFGGALDYVVEKKTGCFFSAQSTFSLLKCIERFEDLSFDAQSIQMYARKYSVENFKSSFKKIIMNHLV